MTKLPIWRVVISVLIAISLLLNVVLIVGLLRVREGMQVGPTLDRPGLLFRRPQAREKDRDEQRQDRDNDQQFNERERSTRSRGVP